VIGKGPGETPGLAPAPASADAAPAYRVSLPEFEGPLDLLLHLCQTHELDILNISIDFIAQKYIEYLELMENMSVEVAADYLVMAAHLAYLKSRELVPSPEPVEASEDGEEPIDPREELIRRLLEYQKYKHAAQRLADRPIEGRNVFVRGAVLQPEDEAGLAEHSVWKLIEHWARTLEKAKPQLTHDVVVDRISISDRINQLVDMLEAGNGMVQFDDLIGRDLPEAELRHKVVVSLLAVLELARLRVVRIMHQEATGVFFLTRIEGAVLSDARNLTVTSAKAGDAEASALAAATVAAQEPAPPAPAEVDPPVEPEASDAAAVVAEPEPPVAAPTTEETSPPAPTAPLPAEEADEAAAAPTAPDVAAAPAPEVAASQPDTGDSAGISPQEDVISALPPAPADAGENQSDGQTKAKQQDSSD
jgi:segregation and condensation protein A